MAIVKEYRCLAHGPFDSKDGVCPHGCGTVVREFRTAPGLKAKGTKQIDKTLDALASRFGLTDMSNSGGLSVGANREKARGKNDMAPTWGELPKGNNFEVGKGEVQREGSAGGVTAALNSMGMGDNSSVDALAKQNGVVLPSFMDIAGNLPKLRPIIAGSSGNAADLQQAISKAE